MKKIINGKTYNTETARRIGARSNNLPCTDFDYYTEELYVTKDGRYFLAGEGGARSAYYKGYEDGSRGGGEDVLPITAAKALAWAERHMKPDDFRAEFPKEAEAKEMKRLSELQSSAAALYDGGWRAADKEQLKAEYGYTDGAELDAICKLLKEYEQKAGKKITLTEEAYVCGGSLRLGLIELNAWYQANAEDNDGNEYKVIWQIRHHEADDESDACDWDSPMAVFNTDGKDVTSSVEVCR